MAKFKFAVSGQFLDLLTPTRGISDGLFVNSFEFTFRSPEWDTCVEKWVHFYNPDYNDGVPYDFNLIDNQITADRGVNLPAGIWEVFLHGSVLVNDEVVQRYVTESQSIQIIPSGVINAEPLASIGPSVAEQLSSLVHQAYNARITSAGATIDGGFGTPEVDVSLIGDPAYKRIKFDFHNLKGNGIDTLVFTETGEDKGLITITMTDGTVITFDDFRDALASLEEVESHAEEYAGQAEGYAEQAEESKENAEDDALRAEGYAVGEQNGVPVESDSEYYENNSKYFSDQAIDVSEQIVRVQSTQPTEPYNKIWVKEDEYEEVVVPTMDDFDDFVDSIESTIETVAAETANDWIEENLSQETGYVLDRSLTLEEAAAPADLVGEVSAAITWLEYDAKLSVLGSANKVSFHAKSGDSINVKTDDGSNLTIGGIYFQDANGQEVTNFGLNGYGKFRNFTIPNNVDDIYYVWIGSGTANPITVTNLSSEGYTFRNKMLSVQVDVQSQLIKGKALADGTFSNLANTRYVKRSAIGVKRIVVHSAYWSTPKIVFYANDGSVISALNGTSGENDTTTDVPNNAVFYAANNLYETQYLERFAITETWQTDEKEVYINENLRTLLTENENSKPKIVLPTFIPAVVDIPNYLYYENVLANGMAKDYVISNNEVHNTDKCKLIKQTSAGNQTVNVVIYNNDTPILTESTVIRTVAKNTSGTANILIIGDSKSSARWPWIKLKELLDADANVSFSFLGQITQGGIAREAYSGKDIINLCDDSNMATGVPNIFYDSNITTSNNHHFSFTKGITTLGATPDIVIIDYGANMWADSWTTVKGCYDDVIASIKSANANTKIVIVIQEGTGLKNTPEYRTDGKWWLWNPTYTNAQKLLSEYRNRDSENIFIMPSYVCVDLYNDFPICSLPQFEGANGERDFCMDTIHPGINADNWSSSKNYKYGDWVSKNLNGYGCKKANTNIDPETDTSEEYWAKCKNQNDGYMKKGLMYYAMLKYLMTV